MGSWRNHRSVGAATVASVAVDVSGGTGTTSSLFAVDSISQVSEAFVAEISVWSVGTVCLNVVLKWLTTDDSEARVDSSMDFHFGLFTESWHMRK